MKLDAKLSRAVLASSRSGGFFSMYLFASSKRALPPVIVFSLSSANFLSLVNESLLREADTSSSPSF